MTMDERELKSALEAIIFASGEPVPAARISLVLGVPEEDVFSCAAELAEEYEREGRGIRLVRLDKSLQMCSAPQYAKTIARVIEHRAPPKLSPPALETLAVIAYFQPVTRAYVDEVRGVDSSYTVSSLVEKGLIEAAGRLEAPAETEGAAYALIQNGESYDMELELPAFAFAPISEGERAGRAVACSDGQEIASVRIVYSEDVEVDRELKLTPGERFLRFWVLTGLSSPFYLE